MQGSWDEAAKVDLKRFPECNWGHWRLPTSVKPDQYELELFTTLQVRPRFLGEFGLTPRLVCCLPAMS